MIKYINIHLEKHSLILTHVIHEFTKPESYFTSKQHMHSAYISKFVSNIGMTNLKYIFRRAYVSLYKQRADK